MQTLRPGAESAPGVVGSLEPVSAGLRVLIPGAPQWHWGQRERGAALFGSCLGALAVGAFAWGTPLGLAVLAFGAGAHVVSVVDAWRQAAFPALGKWAPWLTATSWVVGGVYGPAVAAAALVAWPGLRPGSAPEGYLVNCRAYLTAEPRPGDWVWFRPAPWADPRLGRVVAASGQEVEWSSNRLRVDGSEPVRGRDGRPVYDGAPARPPGSAQVVSYRVPVRHVLVNPSPADGKARPGSEGLVIVGRGQVLGRAWAQYYPVFERRFLD